MNEKTKHEIGKLSYKNGATRGTYTLNCNLINSASISFTLLDESGRVHWQEKSPQAPGPSSIELNIPSSLKKGSYNLWIDVEGQVKIRSLTINGDSNEGLLERIKKLFS